MLYWVITQIKGKAMPSQQIIHALSVLSPQARAQITSIDVHPRLFVGLCMEARAESPVAQHPSHIYGIKIIVNNDLKVPYSFVIAMKPDENPTKTTGYRPTMIICDDLISE